MQKVITIKLVVYEKKTVLSFSPSIPSSKLTGNQLSLKVHPKNVNSDKTDFPLIANISAASELTYHLKEQWFPIWVLPFSVYVFISLCENILTETMALWAHFAWDIAHLKYFLRAKTLF